MILKLSFKDSPEIPYKRIKRNGDMTTVTLTGSFKIPSQISRLPQSVIDWMFQGGLIYRVSADNVFFIGVTGKTTRHPNDIPDSILAERIAEARAKLKLYKFMHSLASKLSEHLNNFQYGESVFPTVNSKKECLFNTILRYGTLIGNEYEHLNKLMN